ncbi:Crp/Fnr family transcriptional regulator [Cellulophaga sp. E16_2]|uniref:Transcriptional regulator, Crp/Fnr family n=1 Tax=Cellulophaga algicola (strain DSM 14237 / IC166 / ACAM 630) TaxID=688270 RepID=E6X7R8_CELAD|nr:MULTISPECIES: Crp/Fnr family transcriptional regulator [Cellulophaga]ADV47511.1 putative transcriptional regulator, Crp/Fnr family [Cellulophaga algicola DSM 14237]MBO0589903.1 Crp/Fnr family transcriptional regulator [Cellulophaga sp. E16_2]
MAKYTELTNFIKKNIEIEEEELEIVLSYFKTIKKSKNEILLSNGINSQVSYFVKKGCLRLYYIDDEGKDITRYIAFENQFATELVSFITNEPAQETIQVIENSELLYITHDDFKHLMHSIPKWKEFYTIYLEKAYVNNSKRLISFTTLDASERYKQLFKINPNIVRRLPNKIVASYINISQETLSRIKSKI